MFATNTVDGVLKSLSKAVTDLEVVAEKQQGIGSKKSEEAERLEGEARGAFLEADRAKRVRSKLEELLS